MVKEVRNTLREDLATKLDAYDEVSAMCRSNVGAFNAKIDAATMAHTKNERLVMIDGPVLVSR